ncbi:MAG TPA: nuclear transport factor 2 family protein, partial [Thermomicrobiales bacterium]|nr:nuclear transport factor 2 family protein [Thermomicrobiales bacterium]
MPTTPPALRQRSAAGFANPRGSRRLTLERGGAVHRPPRLLTLAVTLAIAVSLLAVGVALAPLPPSTAESSTGGRAVAFAFYDVLNQALRSGDFVALDAVVAPDLITHDALGISRGRTVLEQRLAALRVFAPKLRLTPGEQIVDGDRAAVSVVATTRGDGAAQGNAPAMGWAALDLLRIADGRVVERWAFDEPGAAAQLAAQAALPSPPPEPVQATVVRFTFDPGANAAGATGGGPLVIALEQGSLLVRRESAATAASTQAAGSTGDVSLRPADALVIPAGVHFSLRNVGGAQTVFAVAALTSALLRPGGVLEGQTATNPAGVSLGPQWPVGVRAEALAASAPSRPPT